MITTTPDIQDNQQPLKQTPNLPQHTKCKMELQWFESKFLHAYLSLTGNLEYTATTLLYTQQLQLSWFLLPQKPKKSLFEQIFVCASGCLEIGSHKLVGKLELHTFAHFPQPQKQLLHLQPQVCPGLGAQLVAKASLALTDPEPSSWHRNWIAAMDPTFTGRLAACKEG